jgi:hypothetical protein
MGTAALQDTFTGIVDHRKDYTELTVIQFQYQSLGLIGHICEIFAEKRPAPVFGMPVVGHITPGRPGRGSFDDNAQVAVDRMVPPICIIFAQRFDENG